MTADVAARLQKLQRALEEARTLKSKAEGRKEQLEAERQQILEEMQAEGVTPDTLEEEIARLRGELEAKLTEAESLVPWDLIGEALGGGARAGEPF